MKKKNIKIFVVVFIIAALFFTNYKINSMKEMETRVIYLAKSLINSIANEDYESIKKYIKTEDGTNLTDEQINNFLFNTELYRILIKDDEREFYYTVDTTFLNPKKGSILFYFNALDGDKVTNKLKYSYSGEDPYFITDKLQEAKIKKKKYPIATDLANGQNINITSSEENISQKITILSYVKDEIENAYVEIIEPAEEDVKVRLLNIINDRNESLKKNCKECHIESNQDKSIISIYCDESMLDNTIISLELLSFSYLNQVLDGNKDWHLTIEYYNYITKELLMKDIVR